MERRALIIGISDYEGAPLNNPVNDARLVTEILQSRGFRCMTLENASGADIENALEDFTKQIDQQRCFTLIFFAGHGIEKNGAGYVLPRDFPLPIATGRLRHYGIPITRLLSAVKANSGPKLLIIDACRSSVDKSIRLDWNAIAPELDEMRSEESSYNDLLIAYSTSAGEKALDGKGQHSLFCEHFCNSVIQHGLSVEDAIKQVGKMVMQDSRQGQRPWYYSSLNTSLKFSDLPKCLLMQNFTVPESIGVRGSALDVSNSAAFICSSSSLVYYFTSYVQKPFYTHHQEIAGIAAISDECIAVLDKDSNFHLIDQGRLISENASGKADCRDPFGIRVSPNKSMFAVYGINSFAVLSSSGKCLYREGPHHHTSYYCAQFINDDRVWFGGSGGQIVEIQNLQTKPRLIRLGTSITHHLYSMTLLGDGAQVACVYGSGKVEIRDSSNRNLPKEISLNDYVQTPSARRASLVNVAPDEIIHKFLFDPMLLRDDEWDILSRNLMENDLLFCACSKKLPILAVGSSEGLVYLIDTRDGQVFQTLDTSAGQGKSINGIQFIESDTLVVLTGDSSVNFYKLA
ncbi:caspase family protein [Methylocaldum sp. GT1BB]|jgi:WD40 repeat protein|uniref:caspase family protein n=1 Tax=Methylocaldum sp. GT1BB TaxID=3438963 RepID=UPI003DA13469